jgi:hypothetical protein
MLQNLLGSLVTFDANKKCSLKFYFCYCVLAKKIGRDISFPLYLQKKNLEKISQIQLCLPATKYNNVQILRLITSALILNNLPCRPTKKYYLLSTDHSKTTLPYNHPFCDILTLPSCTLQQNTDTFYLHPNFLSNCRQGHYSTSKS